MTDFDAFLKRSFAEAPEPVDDGFTVKIGHTVARRENAAKLRNAAYSVGMAAAGAAALYGVYSFVGAFGDEFLAGAGLQVVQAYGALSGGAPAAEGLFQSLGAGLTQILLVTAALAGGAVAYRNAQQD